MSTAAQQSGATSIPVWLKREWTMPDVAPASRASRTVDRLKKGKRQPKPQLPLQRKASTIPVFCQEHGFSRSTYYNLKKKGLAPAETQLTPGGKKFITEESAAAWRAKYTAGSGVDAGKRGRGQR